MEAGPPALMGTRIWVGVPIGGWGWLETGTRSGLLAVLICDHGGVPCWGAGPAGARVHGLFACQPWAQPGWGSPLGGGAVWGKGQGTVCWPFPSLIGWGSLLEGEVGQGNGLWVICRLSMLLIVVGVLTEGQGLLG